MTILEHLKQHLEADLLPRYTDEVLLRMMADPNNQYMRGKWNNEARGPLDSIIQASDKAALRWIEEKLPDHHKRQVFVDRCMKQITPEKAKGISNG